MGPGLVEFPLPEVRQAHQQRLPAPLKGRHSAGGTQPGEGAGTMAGREEAGDAALILQWTGQSVRQTDQAPNANRAPKSHN